MPVDDLSEFVITASDGLWDYYSPESSVLSDTRRQMRRLEDTQAVSAGWGRPGVLLGVHGVAKGVAPSSYAAARRGP